MIKQYRGADRAINYLFENAKEVTVQRYLTTGTLIATLSIDNTTFDLYSAGGDNVAWNQLSISGTKIAQISINGNIIDVYAPTAGGATALSGLSDVNLFSPTDGQVLKYDATNQVWINANESGGSSTLDGLSDVSITTPTDGQVLAYDSTSGEWVNSNVGRGGGLDYSYQEQNTGLKWVNGKTIYQKSVDFGALPNNTSKSVAHNITGLDDFVNVEKIYKSSAGYWYDEILAQSSLNNIVSMNVDSTNINISTRNNFTSISCIVTLWYTKT